MGKARTYFLPWPPSVNALWRAVKGRNILSERGRRWYDSAGEELKLQRPKAVRGIVSVTLKLFPPTRHRFDIDNRAKATLDALVRNGIIESDDCSILKRLTIELGDKSDLLPTEDCGAYVTVEPWGAA